MNIKTFALSASLVIGSLFGVPAIAETHVACGDTSFAIGFNNGSSNVMFHNGGVAYFHHANTKTRGVWWWQGADAVSNIGGHITVWDNARYDTCDFRY